MSWWLRSGVVAGIVVPVMAWLAVTAQEAPAPVVPNMAKAANAFLFALPPDQAKLASFAYDDAERFNWHFIPRERKGVALRQLSAPAYEAALTLLASGLSPEGYEQTLAVMSLEEVLYLVEGGDRAARREKRDPKKYYLSVFGTPSDTGTWGWRFEGHHLSLNYTLAGGKVVSSTPEFFGSNPADIAAGPGRQIRVLAAEEDLARQILKLASPELKQKIVLDTKAPDDLRGANKPQPELDRAAGVPFSAMNEDQRQLLMQLLAEYLKNMPAEVSSERRRRLVEGGFESIHFAWWGEEDRNKRHYYRIQGPSFIIEYNNTQSDANHVHSFWRDVQGDFAVPNKG
jgi:hypothetical protein